MNLIEFNKILIQPSQIKKDQIDGLHKIIEEFPYFHVAHFLHLKALKTRHSFKYNDYLKKTAAYTTDRSVLFDSITSDDLDIHPAPANLISEKTAQEEAQTEAQDVEDANVITGTVEENVSPEETLGIGRPLKFKSDESHSFQEWLQLSSFTPIERVEPSTEGDKISEGNQKKILKKDSSNMKLVDDFIASSPKINPSLQDSYTDIAQDSVRENESLMTETLAHVYVAQKKYEKAITAFTILSLKYPEKSSFFAHQIQAIKKLQEK